MSETRVFFRQISTGGVSGQFLDPYFLPPNQTITIGRDPSCQLILDPNNYTVVSRRHAKVTPINTRGSIAWQLEDLGSANGTYLNGRRLESPQIIQSGDRIKLGDNGPEFTVEYEHKQNRSTRRQTVEAYRSPRPRSNTGLSFTQLFPIVSKSKDLTAKAFLLPGIFTVLCVIVMFLVGSRTAADQQVSLYRITILNVAFSLPLSGAIIKTIIFNSTLAIYISTVAFYFVYSLCGKRKAWWVLFGSFLITFLQLLVFYLNQPTKVLPFTTLGPFFYFFRDIPKIIFGLEPLDNLTKVFISQLFGAGLMEELFKAIPIFFFFILGHLLTSSASKRNYIGVTEPLDGILLGAASAVGFTLPETLIQYVPGAIFHTASQVDTGTGLLVGLQLLIPRVLGSIAGHMAYSGYFGYFIGLSILKPRQSFVILPIGYITSSLLHALWNTSASIHPVWLVVIGILSYAFLAAAILKARELSPTRSENFATTFFNKR